MLDKILSFSDLHNMLPDSGLVLACVSGGADSMALLEALAEISRERGFKAAAVHYNHMLRGEESDRDEAFVMDFCSARGIAFYSGRGDVKAYALRGKTGLEAAARDMRYAYFLKTAQKTGAARIATAHTADDNAETIIMNFSRGAGAAGLSGIPPVRKLVRLGAHDTPGLDHNELPDIMIVRPMLQVSRDEVMAFIYGRGLPFVEDSTNSLDIFTRNKIRSSILPVIREINPGFLSAATAASELLRADEEYLSEIAGDFIKERCAGHLVDADELNKLPFAVSGRVIKKLCGGRGISLKHVKAVMALCADSAGPPASISLPGITIYRQYGKIAFSRNAPADAFAPVCPISGSSVIISGAGLKMSCKQVIFNGTINKSLSSFLFKSTDICGRIVVRPRREADIIRLLGQSGRKTLKKLFIERRIPARERALVPVIADDLGVLAVYGVGIGDRAAPSQGDLSILIEFESMV